MKDVNSSPGRGGERLAQRVVEGPHAGDRRAAREVGPLHHASHGPPPRSGEDLRTHASPGSTRFAVRSPDATGVALCLFDGERERRLPMTRHGDDWVAETPDAPSGIRYGYRADGPWLPDQGLRFDPTKLLVDTYAVELDRRFAYHPALAIRGEDTAALVPKAIVPVASERTAPEPPLFRPGGLIYEINVQGFTARHPDVPPEQRGTIAALAHPSIVAHLQRLRVAAVELMPIVAWIDERHLPPLGLANAWGYNPVAPMAIDPGLAPGGVAELRDTIAALRAAGIGMILDLVFNHTGESDARGPTLSMRGLGERDWYARDPDDALINDTGTGNTLDFAKPHVRDLTLASLRHFASLGVDGFRFDLAPVLARGPGFDPHAPIFAQIAADPLLSTRVMIAEPWDSGPGGYRLGAFPDTWLEWNDRYRDDVRRFWRGDGGAGALATRLAGSTDVFGDTSRSVNFVAAHDGFTLADLVAHEHRHNEANGEANRDGHADEVSWNNGVEGPCHGPALRAARDAEVRALLATLFASRGTIMLAAGDEFGRSQAGNNNAYAQPFTLDWEGRDRVLEDFVATLAAWRARMSFDPRRAQWFDLGGRPMTDEVWATAQGFELRLPHDAETDAVRIDRAERRVTLSRLLESQP